MQLIKYNLPILFILLTVQQITKLDILKPILGLHITQI